MARPVVLAAASIFGLVGLLMATRSSDAASSTGVLVEVHVRTTQHTPGATARGAPTLAGKFCEPTVEDYARSMAKTVMRQGEGDECAHTYREAAGTVTFTKNCRRPVPTSLYGVFRMVNSSTFTGIIATGYLMAGRLVMIDAEYSGERVGTCKYPQPTK